eukprot:m51a1_g8580 hypothetical protein (166) ;mRNA; f:21651-25196
MLAALLIATAAAASVAMAQHDGPLSHRIVNGGVVGSASKYPWMAFDRHLGNGHCNMLCYTADCNWDEGDCFNETCGAGCTIDKLSNDECDVECASEACSNDNSHCQQKDLCADQCFKSMINNSVCERACNTNAGGAMGYFSKERDDFVERFRATKPSAEIIKVQV